jgi:hypothetical protein
LHLYSLYSNISYVLAKYRGTDDRGNGGMFDGAE